MVVCGMDEVGRGCIAGPLVAAGAILKSQIPNPKLKDSKKLTAKQREEIYQELVDTKIIFVVEFISVEEINQFGIGWANKEIFVRLKQKLNADIYIADGNLKIDGIKSLIKADNLIPEVMAASIIAKVTRDKYMSSLDNKYLWKQNKGYATKKHLELIKIQGASEHHRTRYRPFI